MKLKHLLISLACLLLLAAPAAAAGGDGTSANPYQIETAAELQSIQNDLSAHYILMNDIDLTGVTWTPIGSTSAGFFGELDGNGYTISNLSLSATTTTVGLFGSLTSGATIKDLTLADCHIDSTNRHCGILMGSVIMSESVHEVAILQNIDIVRCSVTSALSSVSIFCGHVSENSNIEIIDCSVSYSYVIADGAYVGSFCGQVNGGSNVIITGCMVDTCILETTSTVIGIFCGQISGISSVLAENDIAENSIVKSSTNYAGGIFGGTWDSGTSISATGCTVKDCTVVATGSYAGGIAGRVGSGSTGVFDSCTVTGCSILANTYAAGVCPAYS